MRHFLFILIPFLLWACFEEDTRVSPYPGKVTTISDSIQNYLSYFNLAEGRTVKTVRNDLWQLGFECGDSGFRISTNSGANWFIFNTGNSSFDDPAGMPDDREGLFDKPWRFPDSTAVGNWGNWEGSRYISDKKVYLLGQFKGDTYARLFKIIFLHADETGYSFACKEPATGFADTVQISKNSDFNFVYYSFEMKSTLEIEPPAGHYDLVFGPYYDLATLFGATIPYPVGGAYLNLNHTSAALDSVNGFHAIGADRLNTYTFQTQRDIPGYRWKGVTVDIAGGGIATYAVRTGYTYIFKTTDNGYFKLRFLSYTLNGRSGFPQFEFEKLE